jgi:hypothetical protein
MSLERGASEARTKRTTFTIDSCDMDELESIAAEKRVSVAWVIRDCIKHYLSERAPLLGRAEGSVVTRRFPS